MHSHLLSNTYKVPDCASSDRPTRILFRPAGKGRYSAWVDNAFLGHAIEHGDGTWAVKAPDDEMFDGLPAQSDALRVLLELRRLR